MGWKQTSEDSDAIHDNVAGEIAAITEKAIPVDADIVLIEDSADSDAKKYAELGNLPGGGGGLPHTWSDFSPTWAGTGGNPSLGNATVVTRYTQQGDVVHANYYYLMGSTTTFGSGNYSWTLPVNAARGASFVLGVVRCNDAGTATKLGIASLLDSTKFEIHETDRASARKYTPTVPHTWNNPDKLHIAITYEAA